MDTQAERLYYYHGVYCTQTTWLLWRDKERHGCPWCNKPMKNRYNNLNRHLRACPARATLPQVKLANEQVIK